MTHARRPLATGLPLSRRDWLRLSGAGVVAYSLSGWLETLAADTAAHPQRRRSCILLWMNGGPSQMDTFDLKPDSPGGGLFHGIQTSVPGITVSQHLPRLAQRMNRLAVIRSMSTKEGDHSRATFLLRTGYLQQGPIHYPTLGSLLSKELAAPDVELPNFVSIAPYRFFNPAAYGPGFLGSVYAPLIVGEAAGAVAAGSPPAGYNLKVEDLAPAGAASPDKLEARLALLNSMERRFLDRHSLAAALSHQTAYQRAVRMMRSQAAKAFDLDDEPASVRDSYGRNRFGQGCLMARRLVERGVPFVEVTLGGVDGNQALGWDTHVDNFQSVRRLSEVLDPAWSALLDDLQSRGLLDTTLIVWMGEFGRTPKINDNGGRDHYPQAWSTVLAGACIHGGQVVGRTSPDGTAVDDRPVSVPDLLATVCRALGVNPNKENLTPQGRPIRIVDASAKPIKEVLA